MNKLLQMVSVFGITLLISMNAQAITLGTGSSKGVFYPFGQKICAKASESFVDCTAPETGGSGDNVKAVQEGSREAGLAMLKVAAESGLPYKELQIGEGSFIVANQGVATKILNKVAGNESAVYSAAIKLASMGRVVFVTIGENSGETLIMKEQLSQAGAQEDSLIKVKDQADFLREIQNRDNAFGYFSRVPLSSNSIFGEIAENKMVLMGAFNPAFKQENIKISEVEVAGFKVRTPVMPIAIVYKDESNKDVMDVVKAASGIELESLVEKKSGVAKWMAKLSKWTSSIKSMAGDGISTLSQEIEKAVANMKA